MTQSFFVEYLWTLGSAPAYVYIHQAHPFWLKLKITKADLQLEF